VRRCIILAFAVVACDDAAAPTPDVGAVEPGVAAFLAVTFNTGTPGRATSDALGYGRDQARHNDEWYGNGLAWPALIEGVATFLAEVDPDLVAFQEVFWPGACADIPPEARAGFVCEGWRDDDPVVMQAALGAGWQVACHPGHPDKCIGVRARFGRIRGCEGDLCLDGLAGFRVPGCGHGARVARAVVERVDGSSLTVVSVHGSSGFTPDDVRCRVAQVEQVFVDLGDGRPAADGEVNVVLGDLNTDPGRFTTWDESAQRWLDHTGEGVDFVTELGPEATASYSGVASIDHVLSDALVGECFVGGVTASRPTLAHAEFFDHRPVVCALRPR